MDPAFVWERPSSPPPPRSWVTLDMAAEITGIPAQTIRNWARKQKIASRLVDDERVVLRSDVVERAHRRAKADEAKKNEPAPAKKGKKKKKKKKKGSAQQQPVAHPTEGPPPPRDAPSERPPEPPIPEGSMLVPIDEWRRLLNQLGNLHEAGQQLAEARERAAKAETESQFLKERVRDLRTRLEDAERTPQEEAPPPPEPVVADVPPETADPGPFWLYLVRRWGTRRR